MGDTSEAVEINMASSVELCSSLLEQLREALTELESQNVIPNIKVQWKDIEAHFRDLESTTKKKIEELEVKEKELKERESHNHNIILEREKSVVEKERDMLDKLQELKDAAMAAIIEAKENCSLEPAGVVDANGNEVSSFVDPSFDSPEEKSPHEMEESEVVMPLEEVTKFCEEMDSIGLVRFISGNLKKFSSVWKEELSVVLGGATEPVRLVLDALEGFFPPKEGENTENTDSALSGMRRSCLILMEALSAIWSKSGLDSDCLNPDIQEEAKTIANNWKVKLSEDSNNNASTNEKSLEVEGFLRLISTFRIASDFDEEELCKFVLAVGHHRQATELCRSLDLTQKIPGLVETLIGSGRQTDAVHFIQAFGLTEVYPPVPLLQKYLKDLRRNLQGNGSASLLNKNNKEELKAVRAVIECIELYKLEDYPLEPLYKRVAQLDKTARTGDRKRIFEPSKSKEQQPKKPRSDHDHRGQGSRRGRHGPPPPKPAYPGIQERYNPAIPNPYTTYSSYPVSSVQSSYTAQESDQTVAYYSQDIRPPGVYNPAVPSYGSTQAVPSYGASPAVQSYGASPAVPNYGSYYQPSNQPQT